MNDDMQPSLSHLDERGQARMVDISDKAPSARTAVAESLVHLGATPYGLLAEAANAKGDALNTARIAGILAAKRCADLIPLCHSLPLDSVGIDFQLDDAAHTVRILATCRSRHATGVEMEAMTAASVAALTLYDMCKAAGKGIEILHTRLLFKSGGKHGTWERVDD